MSAEYALRAAERMHESLEQNYEEQFSGLAAALRIGCSTLGRLVHDCQPGFRLYEDIYKLRERYKEDDEKIYQCVQNIEEFMDTFLFIEGRALIQAGASPRLVNFVFNDINKIRRAIDNMILVPDDIKGALMNIKDQVCEVEREIKTRRKAISNHEEVVRWIKRGVIGIAGGGLIGLNATSDAITTLGLAPWMTALSGALGSGLISEAYNFAD